MSGFSTPSVSRNVVPSSTDSGRLEMSAPSMNFVSKPLPPSPPTPTPLVPSPAWPCPAAPDPPLSVPSASVPPFGLVPPAVGFPPVVGLPPEPPLLDGAPPSVPLMPACASSPPPPSFDVLGVLSEHWHKRNTAAHSRTTAADFDSITSRQS